MNKDTQRAILRACARFLSKSLAPIVKRLDSIEKTAADRLTKGDADALRETLEKRLDQVTREPGPKGDPGRDADQVDLPDVVAELVRCPELVPVLSLLVTEAVAKHFAENPLPPPPKDGKDGAQGPEGPAGQKGDPGSDGKDGVGLAGAVIDRSGSLVVTLTDGSARELGAIVGKDGRDGVDGKDGLSFEHATGAFDVDRGFVITLASTGKTTEFVLPYMVHRGFWSDGKPAKAGESMTHDGALWIAKRDTGAKPCLENVEDWILAARKGRDGKDGRNGIDKTAPVKVAPHA